MGKNKKRTYKVRDVVAIGETAGGAMSRSVINAVRRGVCSGSGGEVIVVAVVDKRVSEHEECTSLGPSAKAS